MFDLVFLLPDDGARKTIQSKILALHLQQVLLGIISLHQTGFMLGRYSFHNTRRLLNILNMPSSTTPEVVVSLDAEKAFDQGESGFLCSFCANKLLVFTPFSTPPWHMAGMSTVPLIVCHSH